MLIYNIIMVLFPALFALFCHNYVTHGKLSGKRKVILLVYYFLIVNILTFATTWLLGFKSFSFARMTGSYKLKSLLLGCIWGFIVSLTSALLIEKNVTSVKLSRYLHRFLNDAKKYYRYAIRSANADLRSEVANSYLNWLWWLVEPFCMMMIYTWIFDVVFHASEPFFPVFIFSGLAMWSFFSRSMNVSVNIVRNNKSIISKIYLPKFILYFARMLVNGFKMLVSYCIVIVMLLIFRVPISLKAFYVIPVMLVFFLFTFGLGTILMHFGVYLSDLSYIVSILLTMLMYLTGIFYNVAKRVPAPYGELLEQFNPVAFCIASVRNALLYNKAPQMSLLLIWTVISLILSALGVYTIYRNENAYVKVI